MKITMEIANDTPIGELDQFYEDYKHFIINIQLGKNYPEVVYNE